MLKLGPVVSSRWDGLRKKTVRSFKVISDLDKPELQAKEIALYVASVPADKLRKEGDVPLFFSSTASEGCELHKQGTDYRAIVVEKAEVVEVKARISLGAELGLSQAGIDQLILASLLKQ